MLKNVNKRRFFSTLHSLSTIVLVVDIFQLIRRCPFINPTHKSQGHPTMVSSYIENTF